MQYEEKRRYGGCTLSSYIIYKPIGVFLSDWLVH